MVRSDIYGMDDNTLAESIASDALTPGNGEDYWGGVMDARAESYDGTKDPQPGDTDILKHLKAGAGNDGNMDSDFSRSSPRHRSVDLSAENGVYTPPKRFSGK